MQRPSRARVNLPGQQRQQERQLVVDDVPGVQQATQQQHQGQQQERRRAMGAPAAGARAAGTARAAPAPPAGRATEPSHPGGRAVAGLLAVERPSRSRPCSPRNHQTCHGWKISPRLGLAAAVSAPAAPPSEQHRGHDRRGDHAAATVASATAACPGARSAPEPPRALPTACWRSPGPAARPRAVRGWLRRPAPLPRTARAPSSSSGWPISSARSVSGLPAHRATASSAGHRRPPRLRPRGARAPPREATEPPDRAPPSSGTAPRPPPPQSSGASAKGARRISEPPYAGSA